MTQPKKKALFTLEPPNAWDAATELRLKRLPGYLLHVHPRSKPIDPGVNFFVLMLEREGCKTKASCEGHPEGFYLWFEADDGFARKISKASPWLNVEVSEEPRGYILRMRRLDRVLEYAEGSPSEDEVRVSILRKAAKIWETEFGPLETRVPAPLARP